MEWNLRFRRFGGTIAETKKSFRTGAEPQSAGVVLKPVGGKSFRRVSEEFQKSYRRVIEE
jgi:hypothetical protein